MSADYSFYVKSIVTFALKFLAYTYYFSLSQCEVVMATGLSRPGKSWEGPGTGQDRTGPRDLEEPLY